MESAKIASLIDFVKESTKHFDSSHNHEHAEKVYSNTMTIINSMYQNKDYDEELITFAALLHDVRDHKYPESISEEKMNKFIFENVGEEKGRKANKFSQSLKIPDFPENLKPYLTALRDADRLEAIGQIGIERCVQFNVSHGYKYPEDVVQHCHDKLLRIFTEHFIVTEMGRKLAEPLHQDIVDFVKICEEGNHPPVSQFITAP
eukprot:403369663